MADGRDLECCTTNVCTGPPVQIPGAYHIRYAWLSMLSCLSFLALMCFKKGFFCCVSDESNVEEGQERIGSNLGKPAASMDKGKRKLYELFNEDQFFQKGPILHRLRRLARQNYCVICNSFYVSFAIVDVIPWVHNCTVYISYRW